MSRTMLVAGNWKMNLGPSESLALAESIGEGIQSGGTIEVAVFPQMACILPVAERLAATEVGVGAQNGHPAPSGAFTGETSIAILSAFCRYILAGHSERRHVFGESDQFVGDKVRAILASGCRAILCVGETLDERRAGDAESVVVRQLTSGLDGVDTSALDRVTVAYEPVWAIGTGVAATPQDAQAMCASIRSWLRREYGAGAADSVRVLYGGSVTPENASALFALADVDGGLVGGASLKPESFLAIVAAARSAIAL